MANRAARIIVGLIAAVAIFGLLSHDVAAALKPLHDRILVRRQEEEEQQRVGIITPDLPQENSASKGTVLAVGSGRVSDDGKVQPLDVKAGDTVLFLKYSGTEVKVDGEELLIIREDDVLGVLEN